MAQDKISLARLKVMERKLYKLYQGIMAPGAIRTWIFGLWVFLAGRVRHWHLDVYKSGLSTRISALSESRGKNDQ